MGAGVGMGRATFDDAAIAVDLAETSLLPINQRQMHRQLPRQAW